MAHNKQGLLPCIRNQQRAKGWGGHKKCWICKLLWRTITRCIASRGMMKSLPSVLYYTPSHRVNWTKDIPCSLWRWILLPSPLKNVYANQNFVWCDAVISLMNTEFIYRRRRSKKGPERMTTDVYLLIVKGLTMYSAPSALETCKSVRYSKCLLECWDGYFSAKWRLQNRIVALSILPNSSYQKLPSRL